MIYLLPLLAVILSFLFVYLTKPKSQKNIKLLLAFSGAFLLALTFFELLPEVYQESDPKEVAVFILAGILLQVFLEFFSKGAEHGHVHFNLEKKTFPIVLLVSLSIHALIEGVPITQDNNILYGILVHKVPVALILSIFLINSNLNRGLVLLFMVLFGLMTPFGSFLALHTTVIAQFSMELTALAIGIFLHISTIVLFESAQGHAFNLRKLTVIIFGIAIAYFI